VFKKEWSYTSAPPIDRTACTEPQCLYSRAIPLLPPWSRTACTEPQFLYSTDIPLLPLLAVRPVQSLSACTVELYLYSPYRPYGLYRASVPVQYSYNSTPPIGRTACTEPQCLYSTAIPLLPLLAVRPVQNLSDCSRVHFTFIFTLNKGDFTPVTSIVTYCSLNSNPVY